MFYKRKNKAQPQGLGHVIGVDNQQIFVKYGGEYYRVTPIDIQPGRKKVLDKRRGSAVDKEKEVRGDTEAQGISGKDFDSNEDYDVYHRDNANAATENERSRR